MVLALLITYCLETWYGAKKNWFFFHFDINNYHFFAFKAGKSDTAIAVLTVLSDFASIAYIVLTVYFAKRLAKEENMNLNKFASGAHAFGVVF